MYFTKSFVVLAAAAAALVSAMPGVDKRAVRPLVSLTSGVTITDQSFLQANSLLERQNGNHCHDHLSNCFQNGIPTFSDTQVIR